MFMDTCMNWCCEAYGNYWDLSNVQNEAEIIYLIPETPAIFGILKWVHSEIWTVPGGKGVAEAGFSLKRQLGNMGKYYFS